MVQFIMGDTMVHTLECPLPTQIITPLNRATVPTPSCDQGWMPQVMFLLACLEIFLLNGECYLHN